MKNINEAGSNPRLALILLWTNSLKTTSSARLWMLFIRRGSVKSYAQIRLQTLGMKARLYSPCGELYRAAAGSS